MHLSFAQKQACALQSGAMCARRLTQWENHYRAMQAIRIMPVTSRLKAQMFVPLSPGC